MHKLTSVVALMVASTQAWSEAPRPLRLRLATGQETYAPYEPVIVQYALENTSDATVSYPGAVGRGTSWVKLEVGDSGRFVPYRTGSIDCAYPSDPRLAPHASLRAQIIMTSNQYATLDTPSKRRGASPFPFAEAGQYEIRASYPRGTNDPTDAFVATPVRIRIREGTERERQAIAFFGSLDALAAAMGGEPVLERDRRPFATSESLAAQGEAFLIAFADTPYAPYVRLNLAHAYLAEGAAPPRPDLAAAHLKVVVDSGPRGIADDALLALAKAALNEGKVAEAEAATTKLLQVFPDSELSADAERIAKGLRAGRRTLRDILGE
jgi:hypothetical protein